MWRYYVNYVRHTSSPQSLQHLFHFLQMHVLIMCTYVHCMTYIYNDSWPERNRSKRHVALLVSWRSPPKLVAVFLIPIDQSSGIRPHEILRNMLVAADEIPDRFFHMTKRVGPFTVRNSQKFGQFHHFRMCSRLPNVIRQSRMTKGLCFLVKILMNGADECHRTLTIKQLFIFRSKSMKKAGKVAITVVQRLHPERSNGRLKI